MALSNLTAANLIALAARLTGERVLFPAVRSAPEDTRSATLHPAEILHVAMIS